MGSPMAIGSAVPIRSRTSLKIRDSRSATLMWLAIWNRRLFWPPKKNGTTVARERWISWAVKGCHGPSSAGFRPSLSGEVETAPAGKTMMQPPRSRWSRAMARVLRLVASASGVPAKSTGRR